MAEEFPVSLQVGNTIRTFFHSQLFRTPPYPTDSFENQVVIVTGSNIGLGFEAARHFYRLNCAKLILAVRTISKGEAAKEDIVRSVKHRTDAHVIEVWPLDLSSTKSVLDFAERTKKELSRLDVLVENAGINEQTWSAVEGFERIIQVNVINTFLLGLLLLPKLEQTKAQHADSSPHLEIVSSEAHRFTKFKELNASNIYEKLNTEEDAYIADRYSVSKLLEVLFVRELVSRLKPSTIDPPPVTITLVNPGLCASAISRNLSVTFQILVYILGLTIGRTAEVGARTLVYGACAGPNSHGEFMSDGQNQDVEKWIYEGVGRRAQKKVFEQTMAVLESRSPGIGRTLGL